jgi:hypothetical protein
VEFEVPWNETEDEELVKSHKPMRCSRPHEDGRTRESHSTKDLQH